ncbi:MAG: VOC family protein [Hyphomicrobiaceae bacterium]|nr:VOC family protein [Hyphomicrobiaceae bacterium]
MNQTVTPFLMFQGRAEEAANLYVATIPDAQVLATERWGKGEPGPEGAFKMARLKLGDLEVVCFDSPMPHGFSFTPSMSLLVVCRDEAEIDRVAGVLAEGGSTLMPLGDHGFSRKFTWLNDRFGVSWQLNLP